MNKKDFERIIRIINKLEYMSNKYEENGEILDVDDIKIFGKYWHFEYYIDFGYFIKRELYCDFSYFADIVEKNDYGTVRDFITDFSLNFNSLGYEVCSDGRSSRKIALDMIIKFEKSRTVNIDDLALVLSSVGCCDRLLSKLFLLSDDLYVFINSVAANNRRFLNGINVISKYVNFNYELI